MVVMVNAEPLRHLFVPLGYDATYLQRTCMEPVMRQYKVSAWSLLGHSMGSFCALHVAPALLSNQNNSNNNSNNNIVHLHKIVLWAVAPFVMAMPADLRNRKDLPGIAVINGTNDAVYQWTLQYMQPTNADWTAQFWAKLPSTARAYTIPNGTHAGFGHYKSRRFPESTQQRAAQQQEAVALTLQFLAMPESES